MFHLKTPLNTMIKEFDSFINFSENKIDKKLLHVIMNNYSKIWQIRIIKNLIFWKKS